MASAVDTPVRPPVGVPAERIAFVVMLAGLVIAPFFTYPLFLMQVMCFALFACAFNLLIGYVGLLSFGHALYFGWASYLAAHSAKVWGFPPELAILTGTLTATLFGIVAGSLVQVKISNFPPNAPVNIGVGRLGIGYQVVNTGITDATGALQTTVSVPETKAMV